MGDKYSPTRKKRVKKTSRPKWIDSPCKLEFGISHKKRIKIVNKKKLRID